MAISKRLAQAAEAQSAQQFSGNNPALGEVAMLAERMMSLEDKYDLKAAELKEISTQLEELATKTIPNAMMAIGLEEFKLTSGAKVSCSQFYSASISETNKPAAHKWLKDNGHGSLIKNELELSFGRGEEKLAEKAKAILHKNKLTFLEQAGVHSSTLRAFVKEQIEAGVKIPLDLFGAFVGRKAKIKRP